MDFKKIFTDVCAFLRFVGKCTADTLKRLCRLIFGGIALILGKIFGTVFGWIKKKLKQPLYDIWCYILTPIAHAWGTLAHSHIHFKKASKEGFWHGVKVFFATLWKCLGGLSEVARWLFNHVAPVVCIIFLISLIKYAGTIQYAISVEYNGSNIGIIENEATYNQAQALVQDKLTYTDNDQSLIVTPKFSVQMIDTTEGAVDSDSLSEIMIDSGDVSVTYAYGLYINEELIGVFNEEEMLRVKAVLERQLGEYYTANTADVSFVDNVALTQGRFIESNLTTADEAIALIQSERVVEAYYVVQKGDSVSLIASKLDITKDELLKHNAFLEDGTHTGDLVTYYFTEPYLSVMTTHYETYDRDVEMQVVYQYDPKIEIGCETLKQSGSDGFENVTALVTEINGVESDRMIISRTVIEEMVPRIFVTGTKTNTYIDDMWVIEKLGTFCWPVAEENYISSLYGYRRWDRSNHKGLDIAAKRGTDIYAAAAGKVIHAGTYSTYGKLVIIDHGDDILTYYAHQSKIYVSKGDYVQKGDVIGAIGMTGSASGNHLHFELRVDDDRIDPMYCLGGVAKHEVNE